MSDSVAANSRPDAPEERRKQMVRAVVASTVGTSIEWYDYFLFGTMAALVFPKLFFPKSDPLTGTLNNYAIFFVGFLARPVGAWLFGTYGDRIGRKATLIATLLFMGVATFLIGIMPTYSTLGLWAAVILVVLRLFQGIGVGGEWGGSVLMSMEWGSQKRKGWLGSWPQFGVPIGLVLANGITALTVTMAGTATFNAWAWRVPFLLSIALVGVGLYIRLGILETPVFQALLQERRVEHAPVREVIRRNWREIVLSALLRLPEQAPFYLFTTFVFTFGAFATKLDKPYGPQAALIAESFTGRLRYSGASLGYQLASVIAGGPAPIIGLYLWSGKYELFGASFTSPFPTKTPFTISAYILICCVIGFLATLALKNRQAFDHTKEYEEQGEMVAAGERRPAMG